MTLIYKILSRGDWDDACASGRYTGSADDKRDGFIHFSAADQVCTTAKKYFDGAEDHVVVTFDANNLGDGLKWERSRGGALFPHLYGDLDPRLASAVTDLTWSSDGLPRWDTATGTEPSPLTGDATQ